MDLNLLTMFAAVADTGNFRAAADRLGVTRSAVSQGIRRLEETIGQPLFQRTTRSVRLTEEGERFLETVHSPLLEIGAALETARSASGMPHGLCGLRSHLLPSGFCQGLLLPNLPLLIRELHLM